MGVVKWWFQIFFIVKFDFCVPKLVSVSIFSLIGRVSILGVGAEVGWMGAEQLVTLLIFDKLAFGRHHGGHFM